MKIYKIWKLDVFDNEGSYQVNDRIDTGHVAVFHRDLDSMTDYEIISTALNRIDIADKFTIDISSDFDNKIWINIKESDKPFIELERTTEENIQHYVD